MPDASPLWIGLAAPFVLPVLPAGLLVGLSAITYSPSELGQYYGQIHSSFAMMNAAIGKVKYDKCWSKLSPEALADWRAFRSSWVEFYSQGPSKWFTVLSGDKAAADTFARGLISWREKLAGACGVLTAPPTQAVSERPWDLQPLPAADPEVQAAAQLKFDAEALKKAIKDLDLVPRTAFPWGWLLAGAGLIGATMFVRRRRA